MGVPQSQDPAIQQLQRQVAELSSIVNSPTSLDQYLDKKSKDIINAAVNASLFDLVWSNYWLYTTNFESLDGFAVTSGVALSTSVGGISLTTAGSGADFKTITKNTSNVQKFSFKKDSRMSSVVSFIQITAQTGHLTVGTLAGDSYGFSWVNGTLSAVASHGGVTTTIALETVLDTTHFFVLEARFFAGTRVDFYVNKTLQGSISTNLPITFAGYLWEAKLAETAAASKVMGIYSFDFIQKQK